MLRRKHKLMKDLGEFGFIRQARKKFAGKDKNILGIGDDAAVIRPNNSKLLLYTCDMLVEGVHFKRNEVPKLIGRKALARNISDIAAMGGTPKYALISLGVSPKEKLKFIEGIYCGIKDLADKFGVVIVGGDTARSNKLVVDISLIGAANLGKVIKRSGANPGDKIFVTGKLGNSYKSGWHLRFMPRIAEAQYLVKNFSPSAMIDISDGLLADLGHILEESKVGAVIHENKIPKRKGAKLNQALSEGEDFELLFTLPAKEAERLLHGRLKVFCIGEIARKGFWLIGTEGKKRKLTPAGYRHF